MPTFKVGEKVPDVVTPTGSIAVEHGQVGPQHAAADGPQPAQQPLADPPPSRPAARRGPRTRPSSSRSPIRSAPAAARCPATARGRAAGSPSRCAACRGRPARPAHRPPADSVDQRVEHHAGLIPRRQQFVAVLTGVAGAAHPNRHTAEFGVRIPHVVHVRRQPQAADDVGRFRSLHGEHGIRAVLVGDGQSFWRALLQRGDDGGACSRRWAPGRSRHRRRSRRSGRR